MPAELAAALIALAIALAQFGAVELRIRAARRERERLIEQMGDVERKTGVDRRRSDYGHDTMDVSDNGPSG